MRIKKKIGLILQRLGVRMAGKRFMYLDIKCFNKDGSLAWEETKVPNTLVNEGEINVLDVYFRNNNVPTSLWLRLANQAGDPLETDDLTDLTEVSGNGYTPEELDRNTTDFPTLALDGGDGMVTSKAVNFSATGAGWTAKYLYLATTYDNVGLLICWVALSTTRILTAGQILQCTINAKLQ